MDKLDAFLHLYFYYLEKELNKNKKKFKNIKFQSEEANTDEDYKIAMKSFIDEHKTVPSQLIDTLCIKTQKENNQEIIQQFSYDELKNYKISSVLLPQDLTQEMKDEINRNKISVYTNPDLFIKIEGDKIEDWISIELKSTKKDKIPGSSVQQINPNEWSIFVRHNADIEFCCGRYLNTITTAMPFPDRSPRPLVGFNNIKDWNIAHRFEKGNILEYAYDINEQQSKQRLLDNWQKVLCDEWLQTIATPYCEKQKWFNNTIRLFAIELLKDVQNHSNEQDYLNNKIEFIKKNLDFKKD